MYQSVMEDGTEGTCKFMIGIKFYFQLLELFPVFFLELSMFNLGSRSLSTSRASLIESWYFPPLINLSKINQDNWVLYTWTHN